jgi:peptidoglycan/xylan/chitin deacetylase (PgdA/CDA1 family)
LFTNLSNYYFVKMPFFLRVWYSKQIWKVRTHEPVLFLTFDDGPHPEHTPAVLELLKSHQAKVSFFCIGKNAESNPELLNKITEEGHVLGNHTQHHLNGWKVRDDDYLNDIEKASTCLGNKLFRPPYGRIKQTQVSRYLTLHPEANIVMWTVLSGDFDLRLTPEQCEKNILKNMQPGNIIVFHDSDKAAPRMFPALKKILEEGRRRGFRFEALTEKWLKK